MEHFRCGPDNTIRLLRYFTCLLALSIAFASVDSAKSPARGKKAKKLTDEKASGLIFRAINADHLYRRRLPKEECIDLMLDETHSRFFEYSVHEKHGDGCPGDPETFPTLDRFRVNRLNGNISWYDIADDDWLPYNQSTIKKIRD